ncbi:hypothetical protein C5E04_18935 [Pectobacterium parmentieri]|uniref:hypothetical protein n=1 Tax=Pectobacterium parmentieri TaxID=1905730 RepID=UPI000EAF192F|nr:hypothetical protein [Pectobacterium parmentieri]RKO74394.1 hypothetical protein C5E04_18935 [Pectobacterium parmentieri]
MVKFYALDSSFIHDAEPTDGFVIDMVRASDYVELEKRIAELEFIRETSCKVMQEFADELGCKPDNEVILQAIDALKSKVAELEKRRDALVAEKAGLKDLQPTSEMIRAAHKETEEYDNINLDDDLVVFMWQAMHSKIKTPATDTAIAEIGAKAVEQAAMGFHEKCYAAFEGSDEYGLYIRAELMQFANNLRRGGV